MSAYVKLASVRQVSGGVAMSSRTIRVADVDYDVALPFVEVADPVVVTPVMELGADGRSVSIRLDRWEVVHLDLNLRIPLVVGEMSGAVRVAREFERDPGVSWRSEPDELRRWAWSWAEGDNALDVGGDR